MNLLIGKTDDTVMSMSQYAWIRVLKCGIMITKHICEGDFCQVYNDPEFNDEIDNFCLNVGFEIDDISDSSMVAGIVAYLG